MMLGPKLKQTKACVIWCQVLRYEVYMLQVEWHVIQCSY